MDANEVLRKFLSLCNENDGFLQNHLISNSILEWFGKTIRGPHQIHSFYRYNLFQQYEQQFENVRQCEPFETKPSHFQTKHIPPSDRKEDVKKNLLFEKSEILETSLLDLKTPKQERKSPILPALNQGRIFIDDDHDELAELGLSEMSDSMVLPLPSSSRKSDEPMEKKIKITTISKNKKMTDSEVNYQNRECNLMDDLMDQEDLSNSSSNDVADYSNCKYSVLMYLEAFGKLQVVNKQKCNSNKNGYSEFGLYNSPLSNRKVHLKLSFRINRISNELQFALIIYENIKQNSTIRRNLLMEFEEVEDVENEQNFKIENKRKKPVKIALRL